MMATFVFLSLFLSATVAAAAKAVVAMRGREQQKIKEAEQVKDVVPCSLWDNVSTETDPKERAEGG